MFAVVEKNNDNINIVDFISDSSHFLATVNKIIGTDVYEQLENVTGDIILTNQTYKPGKYLTKIDQKYILYNKIEIVNQGYIYNSYDYKIEKITTWYLSSFDNNRVVIKPNEDIKKSGRTLIKITFHYLKYENIDKNILFSSINKSIDILNSCYSLSCVSFLFGNVYYYPIHNKLNTIEGCPYNNIASTCNYSAITKFITDNCACAIEPTKIMNVWIVDSPTFSFANTPGSNIRKCHGIIINSPDNIAVFINAVKCYLGLDCENSIRNNKTVKYIVNECNNDIINLTENEAMQIDNTINMYRPNIDCNTNGVYLVSSRYCPDRKSFSSNCFIGNKTKSFTHIGNKLLYYCNMCTDSVTLEIIKNIVSKNPNLNIKNSEGCTALMLLVGKCNNMYTIEAVKCLINAGADLNIVNNEGQTALMIAAGYCIDNITIKYMYTPNKCKYYSSFECIKYLIQAGANLDLQDYDGQTALMISIRYLLRYSTIESVKLLIESGANLNLKDKQGWTALMIAAGYRYLYSTDECVISLINAGADLNIDLSGIKKRFNVKTSSDDIFDNLVKANIDLNMYCSLGWMMLGNSIMCYDSVKFINRVKYLLDKCDNPNILDNGGYPCLIHVAMNCGKIYSTECIDILLNAGYNVNVVDDNGYNALMYSVEFINSTSSIECVKKLITAGSNVNAINNERMSAIMIAFKNCTEKNANIMIECINILLDNGADLSMLSDTGKTASIYFSENLLCCEQYADLFKKIF